MLKDKIAKVCNCIVKHCTVVFPVIVIVVVAVTVAMALSADKVKGEENSNAASRDAVVLSERQPMVRGVLESTSPTAAAIAPEEVPLTENTDDEIYALVTSYYNSMASGDTDTLTAIHDSLSTVDVLRFRETAQYIDGYKAFNVYLKQGMKADAALACVYYKVCFVNHEEEFPGYQMLYICKNEKGALYIKNEENFTEEERQYILKVAAQGDVVEFKNRVDLEYQDLILAKPELLDYLGELGKQVDNSVGKALEEIGVVMAEQNIDQSGEGGEEGENGGEENAPASGTSVINEPQYAKANATVNVRGSDSENADKIGSVTRGTRIRIQMIQPNGWTKIVYEGKDGYIKSEFLQLEEPAAARVAAGKVTATTNLNIRSAADQSSQRLGLLTAGQSLELLDSQETENGWYKVNYEGLTAYVKAEYVTLQ